MIKVKLFTVTTNGVTITLKPKAYMTFTSLEAFAKAQEISIMQARVLCNNRGTIPGKLEVIEAPKYKINKPWNTGYARGRPRKGEIRPRSINAEKIAKWRAENIEHYREYIRAKQAEWAANNPERTKEISKAAYLRKKQWAKHTGFPVITP